MAEGGELVTVYETAMQTQVAVVKMALQDADIRFLCVNDVVSTVLPIDGMAVVGFRVLEQDAASAREVLEDLGFA
jgi:hypothetical protein